MMETWISPRKRAELVRTASHELFEEEMQKVDRGEVTEELALRAIRAMLTDEPMAELLTPAS